MKQKINNFFHNLIIFPQSIIVFPFKKWDQLSDNKEGDLLSATLWLFLYGILRIFEYRFTGFIINNNDFRLLNAPLLFISSILPLLLLVVANYLVTTLFDGNGSLKKIYLVLCYSLFAVILFRFITVILSNLITKSDYALLQVGNYIGYTIGAIVLMIGLVVIHEYGFFKNVLMIITTLFAFLVLLYVIFLFFHLLQLSFGFIGQFFEEIGFRIKK